MITAAEARKKATKDEDIMSYVYTAIDVWSEKGELSVNFPDKALTDDQIAELRGLGYTVTTATEYTEGIAQTYTKIAW